MKESKIINPEISGKLIFAFRYVRNVALIELRSKFIPKEWANLSFQIILI